MEPFSALIPLVLKTFIQLVYSPLFWVIVLLVAMQYRKLQKTKAALFGVTGEPVWQHTVLAAFHGLIGGFLGSVLMVLVGISLSDIGITWLWPLAIALMLISPRFLCFSYAGGLISLSYLLFGFPMVDVPQLMGLVALLHMVEAILILVSGHLGAMPVYTKNKRGQVIGAFNLQKFWPIPIVAMATLTLPDPQLAGEAIKMPDWWPLIKPVGVDDLDNITYFILPVVAALGYGDLAATSRPQEKSRKSSINLFLYSFVLLGLAIMASYIREVTILAALFGPLGHELVIWLGQKGELNGEPLYVQGERGVMILDVLRESPAAKLGLGSGDVILNVNGIETNNRYDFEHALNLHWGQIEIEWVEYKTNLFRRDHIRKPLHQPFGTILAPGPYDASMVEFGTAGILARMFKRKE